MNDPKEKLKTEHGQLIDPLAAVALPGDWRPVLLKDLLQQQTRRIKVVPGKLYTRLGVRWYAEGPFKKKIVLGREIKSNCLNEVASGDFLYNRLFAWKGSFGVVTDDMRGCVVSTEFPTFEVRSDLADPEFLWRWFSQPIIWRAVEDRSSGTSRVSRLRFKEEDLLRICIYLPRLCEQRAIAVQAGQMAFKHRSWGSLRM